MLNELSPKFQLESQFGVWLPIGGANPVPTNADGHFAGRLFYYGIGPSFVVYESGRTHLAPVVELVGWHVQDGNQTAASVSTPTASTSSTSRSAHGSSWTGARSMSATDTR